MRKSTLVLDAGMTLVEAIVATGIFATACVAAAHLMVWGIRAVWATGAETTALAAAQAKMEELEALTWRFDRAGTRISDPALAPSPADALTADAPGYVDYLDEDGVPVGSGPEPPPAAAFLRRWVVRPHARAPDDTLVIQVLVTPLASRSRPAAGRAPGRGVGASLLTTARTRLQ